MEIALEVRALLEEPCRPAVLFIQLPAGLKHQSGLPGAAGAGLKAERDSLGLDDRPVENFLEQTPTLGMERYDRAFGPEQKAVRHLDAELFGPVEMRDGDQLWRRSVVGRHGRPGRGLGSRLDDLGHSRDQREQRRPEIGKGDRLDVLEVSSRLEQRNLFLVEEGEVLAGLALEDGLEPSELGIHGCVGEAESDEQEGMGDQEATQGFKRSLVLFFFDFWAIKLGVAVGREDQTFGVVDMAMEMPDRRIIMLAAVELSEAERIADAPKNRIGILGRRPFEDIVVIAGDEERAADSPEEPRQCQALGGEFASLEPEALDKELRPEAGMQCVSRYLSGLEHLRGWHIEVSLDQVCLGVLSLLTKALRRLVKEPDPARQGRRVFPSGLDLKSNLHRHARTGERNDLSRLERVFQVLRDGAGAHRALGGWPFIGCDDAFPSAAETPCTRSEPDTRDMVK